MSGLAGLRLYFLAPRRSEDDTFFLLVTFGYGAFNVGSESLASPTTKYFFRSLSLFNCISLAVSSSVCCRNVWVGEIVPVVFVPS